MQIRHERPMSELEFKVRAPLALLLDNGERVPIDEWSLKGLAWPEKLEQMPESGMLMVPFQGVQISFPVALQPVERERYLYFKNLSGRQRETLAVFYRSILSGRMVTTDEIITSLDAPVDLVPMEETEDEQKAATAKTAPRSLRAIATVTAYTLFAMLVFWVLGSGIYRNIAVVNVTNARIEALLVPHISQLGGYVSSVPVAVGDQVVAGDIMVRIVTPDSESALADVRLRISLLEERLTELREREQLALVRLEEARAVLVEALVSAPPELIVERQAALDAFDGRYAPFYQPLYDALFAVEREIADVEDDLQRLRRERGRLRDAADALHVVASQAGIVTDVAVIEGQYAARGQIATTIEGLEPRIARGWLHQSMAAALNDGMQVRLTVNTGDGRRVLNGSVSNITAGIDPEISTEFGMLVGVSINGLEPDEIRQELPHLLPVSMRVQRSWVTSMTDRFNSLLSAITGGDNGDP
ncbi:MAG: HlyD family efflux transporter periplasmic adaptor subunit [Pseudomonadota bacterium]